MEMYYTKREYNQMKNALTSENKRLKKQIEKLQKKVKELEYTKEVVFEPDFELNPVTEDATAEEIQVEDITAEEVSGVLLITNHSED